MKNEIQVAGHVDYQGFLILDAETQFGISASLRERTDRVDISWSSGSGSTEEMIALMTFLAEVRDDIIEAKFPELQIDKCVDITEDAHIVYVGDDVRCWDHAPMEGRPDRYVEGFVSDIDDNGIITVDVYNDTCFTKTPRTAITTPDMVFVDYACRITILKSKESL